MRAFHSLTIVILAFTSLPAFAETCGQLAGVKGGGVEILRLQGRSGESVRYAVRVEESKVVPLECDDIILSGRDSSARIILANGKISLGPESRIEIAAHVASSAKGQPNVSLINLTYGKMRALINRKAAPAAKPGAKDKGDEGQASFRVRTFSAVAGVRGTDFYASYDPNSGLTEQATIEGKVEVAQSGTTQKVLVDGGKQVSVETTPAAVTAAAARLKTGGKNDIEPPKQAPDATVKPIQVVPIQDSVRNEIRVASAAARDDKDFAHEKAIETLGKPEGWTLEREKPPENLDHLKNEF